MREILNVTPSVPESLSLAIDEVLRRSTRHTFQDAKVSKHRIQIESIGSQCLRYMAGCDLLVELGAGQGILGQAISLVSRCPLVAVDRRSNTDAFDEPHGTQRLQATVGSLLEERLVGEKICLVAKHLCGHASDDAIELALRLHEEDKLGLLCLAPCCYVTMSWDRLDPELLTWFEQASFPGTQSRFNLLLDMIRLARGGPKACPTWHLRSDAADGRKACRIINEARLTWLESHGLSVAAVEYCHPDVTPDNLLLLAMPRSSQPFIEEVDVSAPSAVVLLELDPAAPSNLAERVAAYVLPSCRGVSTQGGVLCRTGPEHFESLVRELSADVLLQRVVTRILPFDREAESIPSLLEALGTSKSWRIAAKPRSLEAEICRALPSELLDPKHYTHVLSVFQDSQALRFSLLARDVLDPSAWAERCKEQSGRHELRILEVCTRFKRRSKGPIAVWTDQELRASEIRCWQGLARPMAILRSSGHKQVSDIALEPLSEWHEHLAELLCVEISSSDKESLLFVCHFIQHLKGSYLAPQGTVMMRLRCGKRPKAVKSWLRNTARELQELGFHSIELLHLLVDRDTERTALFDWDENIEKERRVYLGGWNGSVDMPSIGSIAHYRSM